MNKDNVGQILAVMLMVACVAQVQGHLDAGEKPLDARPRKHKCMHDRMMHTHEQSGWKVKEAGEPSQQQQLLNARDAAGALSQNGDAAEDGELTLMSTKTRGKIRIRFDLSRFSLNSDGDRTCYTTGQTYKSGSGGSTQCADGTEDACSGTCTSSLVLTQAKHDYVVNQILPEVEKRLEDVLLVEPTPRGIKIEDGTNCGFYGGVPVPAAMTGGKDTAFDTYDIALFLTGRPTFGGTVAYAGQCLAFRTRPIAGHVNWGPQYMTGASSSAGVEEKEGDIQVIMHEVMHALGFTSSMYEKFRNPSSPSSYTSFLPRSSVIKEVTTTYGSQSHTVSYLKTSAVMDVAQKHFGCSALVNGVALEDGGGTGSAGSHFEKRILGIEMMTASTSVYPVMSAFPLAFLQDTGHYSINWDSSHIQALPYGHGAGCDFVEKDCNDRSSAYFCSSSGAVNCDANLYGAASCDVTQHLSLPPWYQHYTSPTTGGSSSFYDYCGYPSLSTPYRLCADSSKGSSSRTNNGERYGVDGSKCVMSNVASGGAQANSEPKCYQTKCEGNTFKVLVDTGTSNYVNCPTAGGVVQVNNGGLQGSITCPEYSRACPSAVKATTSDPFKTYSAASGVVLGMWTLLAVCVCAALSLTL